MTCKKSLLEVKAEEATGTRLLNYPAQNPAPVDVTGQQFENRVVALTSVISQTMLANLPSNYVSQVIGPNYTLVIQTAAEQLARIQLLANEVFENGDFDFTRPEFLYQTLSSLVFPRGQDIPDIDGDVTARAYMKRMVDLLLDGSKLTSVEEGLQLLTQGNVRVRESYKDAGAPIEDQFKFIAEIRTFRGMTVGGIPSHTHEYDIDCEGNGQTTTINSVDGSSVPDHVHEIQEWRLLTGDDHAHYLLPRFPDSPITYEKNSDKTIRALKPAHTLYSMRFLFQDVFRRIIRDASTYQLDDGMFSDELTWDLDIPSYEDMRWYWEGAERVASTEGFIWADRVTVSDVTRSFRSVLPGSTLKILTGSNIGSYKVASALQLPFSDDPAERPYTTSGALSGMATVVGNIIQDSTAQDFGTLPFGSTLTFTSGPNAGTYRLYAVAGNNGGPLGGTVSGDRVIPDASLLRLSRRLDVGNEAIEYEVGVDKRGRNRPIEVVSEDVSSQFWL